jgi:hypothetical protein
MELRQAFHTYTNAPTISGRLTDTQLITGQERRAVLVIRVVDRRRIYRVQSQTTPQRLFDLRCRLLVRTAARRVDLAVAPVFVLDLR